MKLKTIANINYTYYEQGMNLDSPDESFYIDDDIEYEGNVNCKNIWCEGDYVVNGNDIVRGDQIVFGDQHITRDQDVYGNQYVNKYQTVLGDQYIHGDQDVLGDQHIVGNWYVNGDIVLHIGVTPDIHICRGETVSIGSETKSISEWTQFFANKSCESRQDKEIEIAFRAAIILRERFQLMAISNWKKIKSVYYEQDN